MSKEEWVTSKSKSVLATVIFFVIFSVVITVGIIISSNAVPMRRVPIITGSVSVAALVGLLYWIYLVMKNRKYGLLVSEVAFKYDGKIYYPKEVESFTPSTGSKLAGVLKFRDGKHVTIGESRFNDPLLTERLAKLLLTK